MLTSICEKTEIVNFLRTRAPAKVNLTLRILGVRPNGYHDLSSLVAFTGWGDILTFTPNSSKNGSFTLSIDGPFQSALEEKGDNLVLRAASQCAACFPFIKGGHFSLKKNIPVAAGIGGGSSDAAAALRLLARVYTIPLSNPDLFQIASRLGADVPVCLNPQFQRMEGLGERVTLIKKTLGLYAVLVNPRVPLPTASVFRAFDRENARPFIEAYVEEEIHDPLKAIMQGENSLEPIAQILCPQVTEALKLLRECEACTLARMSGSGPTVWGLFPNRQYLMKATKLLKETYPEWWVRPCFLR